MVALLTTLPCTPVGYPGGRRLDPGERDLDQRGAAFGGPEGSTCAEGSANEAVR